MHAHSSARLIAADFDAIADLIYQPEPTPATGRIRGWPDFPRQRIADLALVLHLADDLVTRCPAGD